MHHLEFKQLHLHLDLLILLKVLKVEFVHLPLVFDDQVVQIALCHLPQLFVVPRGQSLYKGSIRIEEHRMLLLVIVEELLFQVPPLEEEVSALRVIRVATSICQRITRLSILYQAVKFLLCLTNCSI